MKYHLAQSKSYPVPACGKSGTKNQSKGVVFGFSPKEFKFLPEDDCCAMCKNVFLKRRNLQRVEKGLPKVKKYNE